MNGFKIEITSVIDRDKLVSEIWYKEVLIAEINQENENLEIELYPSKGLILNYVEFLEALEMAKIKLIK